MHYPGENWDRSKHMRAQWVFGIALGTILAVGASAADVELQVYDVSEMTKSPVDYPGADLSIRGGQGMIESAAASAATDYGMKVTDLVTLLHDRMFATAFADPSTSIAESSGSMVVMQTPVVQKQIAQTLSKLHTTLKTQLVAKGLLFQSAQIPTASIFDQEELKKLMGDRSAAGTRAAPRVVCYNAQRVHIQSGKNSNYIRDYDVAGTLYDPVVSTAQEGFVFEVHPTLTSDHANVDVDVHFTYSAAVGKAETRSVVMSAPPDAKNEEGAAPAALSLKIDVPSLETQRINTKVRIPKGKWVLAGVMNNTAPDTKEKYMLFFVNVDEAR
jgi:hypothetical protein